jgi:hypothetical protein
VKYVKIYQVREFDQMKRELGFTGEKGISETELGTATAWNGVYPSSLPVTGSTKSLTSYPYSARFPVTLVNAATPYTTYNKDFDDDYKHLAENSDNTNFLDSSTNIHDNTKNTQSSTNNYDSDGIYDRSSNRSIKRQEQFIRHEQYLRQEQAYNYDSTENGMSSTYGMVRTILVYYLTYLSMRI